MFIHTTPLISLSFKQETNCFLQVQTLQLLVMAEYYVGMCVHPQFRTLWFLARSLTCMGNGHNQKHCSASRILYCWSCCPRDNGPMYHQYFTVLCKACRVVDGSVTYTVSTTNLFQENIDRHSFSQDGKS